MNTACVEAKKNIINKKYQVTLRKLPITGTFNHKIRLESSPKPHRVWEESGYCREVAF